jgi:hypothetical protein
MSNRARLATRPRGLTICCLLVLACMVSACREKPNEPPKPTLSSADAGAAKEQAMAALMALPELKAWSTQIAKSSGGAAHAAVLEDDATPTTLRGKHYWQFSFVENRSDAVHRWESFLVAQRGAEILVQDFDANTALTLDQWRRNKHPMQRATALARSEPHN